jgi:hypothetical protein
MPDAGVGGNTVSPCRRSPDCRAGTDQERLCLAEGVRRSELGLPPSLLPAGQSLIIRLIIQTIRPDPSGSDQIDEASNVSRPDPSGADQIDAEHPSRNRKVVGSNPTSGVTALQPPRR